MNLTELKELLTCIQGLDEFYSGVIRFLEVNSRAPPATFRDDVPAEQYKAVHALFRLVYERLQQDVAKAQECVNECLNSSGEIDSKEEQLEQRLCMIHAGLHYLENLVVRRLQMLRSLNLWYVVRGSPSPLLSLLNGLDS